MTHEDVEETYVGKDLGSRQFAATDEIRENYFKGLEIDPSWYGQQSPYGRPILPSMVVAGAETGFAGARLKNDFGNLWIRQEWAFFQPIVAGETYTATSKVVDIYDHRDRSVVKQETTLWGPDGETAARARHHQSFLTTQSSGEVKLRDPKSKEGVRRFAVPEGEALEPIGRTITLEMCGTFFHGNANYHTDKEEARRLGFSDVVVGGRMTISYIGDILDRRFGKGWLEGGRLDVKFVNIVWPDDYVTARAVIMDRTAENGGSRAKVALWMEKQDGTVVIIGTASALE